MGKNAQQLPPDWKRQVREEEQAKKAGGAIPALQKAAEGSSRKTNFTVYIPVGTLDQVEIAAEYLETTTQKFIREAIDEKLGKLIEGAKSSKKKTSKKTSKKKTGARSE